MIEKYNRLYTNLAGCIKRHRDKEGMDIQLNESDRNIQLIRDGVVLHIYIKNNLVGYEIYPEAVRGMRLLSDTDLYDLAKNENMYESIAKELEYILKEYLEGRVVMKKVAKQSIFGRPKDVYSITLSTPSNEVISLELPCINLVNFDL